MTRLGKWIDWRMLAQFSVLFGAFSLFWRWAAGHSWWVATSVGISAFFATTFAIGLIAVWRLPKRP